MEPRSSKGPISASGADESPRLSSEVLENLWNGVEATIEGSFLFRSLDEAARRELVERGVVMVCTAGREILEEGELGDDFYLIDHGVVEVTTSVSGSPVSLGTLQRGGFFGEVAMLTGRARTATVRALTDVTLVRFDKSDIDEVLDRAPSARRLLEAMIAGRAKSAAEKITRHLSTMPPSGGTPLE